MKLPGFALLALGVISVPSAFAGYAAGSMIPLPGDSGWDYLSTDVAARRLYVTHGDRVHVIDLDRLTVVGEIGSLAGVHGVALAPDLGRGFISNGRTGVITVFDLRTLAVLGEWPADGKKPDAILYDAATKRVFSFNGETNNATVFEAATGKLAGTLDLGGAPEFAASNGTGQVYVNIEDTGETVRFDARTLAVTARWPLSPAHTPTGLDFDAVHHRLFSGCRSGSLVVLNADSGAIVATLPIGGGVDAVSYVPAKALVFVSNADGTLNVFHQDDADHYSLLETVKTAPGARTHTVDSATGRVFLASAHYLPAQSPAPGQKPARPGIVPGSFQVLVVQP